MKAKLRPGATAEARWVRELDRLAALADESKKFGQAFLVLGELEPWPRTTSAIVEAVRGRNGGACSTSTAYRTLNQAVDDGIAERVGSPSNNTRWRLTPWEGIA